MDNSLISYKNERKCSACVWKHWTYVLQKLDTMQTKGNLHSYVIVYTMHKTNLICILHGGRPQLPQTNKKKSANMADESVLQGQ